MPLPSRNVTQNHTDNLVHQAVKRGNINAMLLLLDNPSPVLQQNADDRTPLELAALSGDTLRFITLYRAMKLLLPDNPDIDAECKYCLAVHINKDGEEPDATKRNTLILKEMLTAHRQIDLEIAIRLKDVALLDKSLAKKDKFSREDYIKAAMFFISGGYATTDCLVSLVNKLSIADRANIYDSARASGRNALLEHIDAFKANIPALEKAITSKIGHTPRLDLLSESELKQVKSQFLSDILEAIEKEGHERFGELVLWVFEHSSIATYRSAGVFSRVFVDAYTNTQRRLLEKAIPRATNVAQKMTLMDMLAFTKLSSFGLSSSNSDVKQSLFDDAKKLIEEESSYLKRAELLLQLRGSKTITYGYKESHLIEEIDELIESAKNSAAAIGEEDSSSLTTTVFTQ